ncbi:MAG: Rieske (2Fe-2S) protein [Sphingobacteriaceae bacterium]|nr:Rieske (2Fe-2S) protein [Sphingobacteriaceae bacterium]
MTRNEFIKICGGACLAFTGISLLKSCKSTHEIQTSISANRLIVQKKEFLIQKKDSQSIRKFIVVRSEGLSHPIALFKKNNVYTALLMSCTHQQVELTVNGNLLSCSAHGSEFSNTGEVVQGPAEQALKKFKITEDEQNIFIHLS